LTLPLLLVQKLSVLFSQLNITLLLPLQSLKLLLLHLVCLLEDLVHVVKKFIFFSFLLLFCFLKLSLKLLHDVFFLGHLLSILQPRRVLFHLQASQPLFFHLSNKSPFFLFLELVLFLALLKLLLDVLGVLRLLLLHFLTTLKELFLLAVKLRLHVKFGLVKLFLGFLTIFIVTKHIKLFNRKKFIWL
jgi:hypothetical protein